MNLKDKAKRFKKDFERAYKLKSSEIKVTIKELNVEYLWSPGKTEMVLVLVKKDKIQEVFSALSESYANTAFLIEVRDIDLKIEKSKPRSKFNSDLF